MRINAKLYFKKNIQKEDLKIMQIHILSRMTKCIMVPCQMSVMEANLNIQKTS